MLLGSLYRDPPPILGLRLFDILLTYALVSTVAELQVAPALIKGVVFIKPGLPGRSAATGQKKYCRYHNKPSFHLDLLSNWSSVSHPDRSRFPGC